MASSGGKNSVPSRDKAVLIGVIRRPRDLTLLLEQRRYRIPARIPMNLSPRYLAFYQTAGCRPGGKSIRFYAGVAGVEHLRRNEILPDEPEHPRSEHWYRCFHLGPIRRLRIPVPNYFQRRLVFGYTSLTRLRRSRELGEIFGVPPLDSKLMSLLSRARIPFVPQYCVMVRRRCRFRLDFAVRCRRGNLALECDHSRWHNTRRQKRRDCIRDSWLERHGWTVLRFNERLIFHSPPAVLKKIERAIKRQGGVKDHL